MAFKGTTFYAIFRLINLFGRHVALMALVHYRMNEGSLFHSSAYSARTFTTLADFDSNQTNRKKLKCVY